MRSDVSFVILEGVTLFTTSVGFFLNILIIYGIYNTRKSRSTSDFALHLNLSISDLIICLTWITATSISISKDSTLFELELVCKVEGLVMNTFLGATIITLLSIAAFHYKAVVLEMEPVSKRGMILVIISIWSMAIMGSLFGNGLFTGTYGFVAQPSGVYCINDFTQRVLIEMIFNVCIVLILMATPICFLLIYYRIWKKLGLNRHQLFLKRYQPSGVIKTFSINKIIIRRAIAVSAAFAFVFYYEAALYAHQIFTGNRASWIHDAVGACIGTTVTVVNPLLFFALDIKSREAILRLLKGKT